MRMSRTRAAETTRRHRARLRAGHTGAEGGTPDGKGQDAAPRHDRLCRGPIAALQSPAKGRERTCSPDALLRRQVSRLGHLHHDRASRLSLGVCPHRLRERELLLHAIRIRLRRSHVHRERHAVDPTRAAAQQRLIGFDSIAAASCLTALATFLAQCTVPAAQAIPEICEHVLVGLVPLGGACESGGQCAPAARADTSCTNRSPAEQAVCTAPLKLGEPCNQTCTSSAVDPLICTNCSWGSRSLLCRTIPGGGGATCFTNDGLYCSGSGSCASLPSPGDRCPDAVCAPGSLCVQGICGSAAGLPCRGEYDCASANAYCDATKLCAPRLVDSSPCTSAYQCESTQCSLGRCTRSLANEYLCSGKVAL